MLKHTVQFEDFDGVNRTKNLYFNLTLDDVIENADIEDELEGIQRDFFEDGLTRELTLQEKARIVKVVKRFASISYGIQKTVDGELRFVKTPAVWEDFTQSAAYEAFLWGLFQDDETLPTWLNGVFPKEIRAKMAERKNGVDADQLTLPVAPDEPVNTESSYTREALLAMPKEQFDTIVGTDPAKMSQEHLQIAFIRKNTGK